MFVLSLSCIFCCCHEQRCWDFCWCGEQNVHLIPTLSHSFCFCELNVWLWSFTYSFVLIASKNVHVCVIFVCSYREQYLHWKKYLVDISSSELWTREVVDRGMLVLFEKRTQRTTGTILGWQSENTVFNTMPTYYLAKWISVCLFASVPQHFLVGGECQSSFDTFWWKLFLPGTAIIDSAKMHSQEKQHISEMIIKRKRVKSLKFSPVTVWLSFLTMNRAGRGFSTWRVIFQSSGLK